MNNPVAVSLGSNLRRIREQKGVSRKQLADALGVSEVSIGGYENAHKLPPLDKIFAMADFLDVSVSTLTGDNEHNPDFPSVDKIINDYRFEQAKKLALWAGFLVVPVTDGKVILVPAGETVRNADGSFTLKADIKKTSRIFTFASAENFVKFTEVVENFVLNTDAPFKSTFAKLMQREPSA